MKTLLISLTALFLLVPLLSFAEINQYPVLQYQLFILPSGIEYLSLAIVYLNYPQTISEKGKIMLWTLFFAEQHKISFDRITKIIDCESKFNPRALNPKDTDSFPKFGILQFHKPTFYEAGGEDIWSWQEQLEVGTKMMADGYWERWPVCSKSLVLASKK